MTQIALSGVIGALSYALDIAEGQAPGHAVRSCLIGMRLAAELDLSAAERSDLFYALLLKDAGCSANASRMSVLFAADDRAAKATSKLIDWTDRRAAFLWSLRTAASGAGLRRRIAVLRDIRDEGDVTRQFTEARCDRGAEIARMLFLSEETDVALPSDVPVSTASPRPSRESSMPSRRSPPIIHSASPRSPMGLRRCSTSTRISGGY